LLPKQFDLVGAVFLSVAAGGGGTIAVADRGPVRWLRAEPLWAALLAVVVFGRYGWRARKRWCGDAVGLALFTATGMQRLAGLQLDASVTIFLVAIAASGGGVVRDVLANRAPLVFTGEIYVTAAVLGALAYYGVWMAGAGDGFALTAALAVTFLVRAAGIRFAIRLLPGRLSP
jgi:uncharacterized membrane protein YeiH